MAHTMVSTALSTALHVFSTGATNFQTLSSILDNLSSLFSSLFKLPKTSPIADQGLQGSSWC